MKLFKPMKFTSLLSVTIGAVMLYGPVARGEDTIKRLCVTNSTTEAVTYDVSGKTSETTPVSFAETIEIPEGATRYWGGKDGREPTKGKKVKCCKVFKGDVQLVGLVVGGGPFEGAGAAIAISADPSGKSPVVTFFDFSRPDGVPLIANTDFEHVGYEGDRIPILLEVGTETRITDAAGNLLPDYQYNGKLVEVGVVMTPPDISVPTTSEWGVIATTLVMLTVATVVIGRRRRSVAA